MLSPVLDRSRSLLLAWALACWTALALLAVAVQDGWGPIADVDARGGRPDVAYVGADSGLYDLLRWVELTFGTIGMTIQVTVVAVLMLAKGHRRAAVVAALVPLVTALLTTGLKTWIGRARPPWQDPEHLLSSQSFPSGHASSAAAFGGILCVLVLMLVRRAGMRRIVYAAVAVFVVAICLDRVLLGRHYPSDVVGGVLLGSAVLLTVLAAYSPLPRSHAQKSDPLPDAIPGTRRLAVVLNPVKVEDVEVFKTTVTGMAREAGWADPTWHLTTVEDPGTGMAEEAAVAGADLVLVCGGDGTVREVCAELAGTGIPIGIVPAGTGNLLARNLDVPLYLRAAIDVALTGQDRAIDMVQVSGDGIEDGHFMVMAGMGFDAAIMEGVNEDIKKRVGWIAYVISGLKSLMFPAVKIEISVDGGEFTTHRARTVVVGNVGFLQAGMPLLPDAAIDDGTLDVVILHPHNFLAWIPLAWRVLLKRPHTDALIDRRTGSTVVVRAATDTPRQLDGDSIGPGRELSMRCVHGRVLVRVPR